MFEKEVYIARRKALLERLGAQKGIALFLGNVDAPAQYKDNCYKWRQDSNWLYFFGIDEPRFAATIDLETGEETLYADDFDIDDIIWMGPMPSVRSLADRVGVARTAPYDALAAAVKGRPVHFLPASRYYNRMKLASLLGLDPSEVTSASKAGCPKASEPLVRAVISLRLVKEPREIAQIDAACALGYEMHTVARRGIRLGRIEQEIVGDMEGVTLAKGWGTSFPTILTQHGEIFHCHSHALPIEPGKLMVIDAGAEGNDHYASDFTRTYPTSGRFTQKQRDIYQTVYECNELAFSMIRPGTPYRDVHLAVAAHMLDNLRQLDLVRGNIDEMVADGIAGLFMPHGLGTIWVWMCTIWRTWARTWSATTRARPAPRSSDWAACVWRAPSRRAMSSPTNRASISSRRSSSSGSAKARTRAGSIMRNSLNIMILAVFVWKTMSS